MDKLTVEQQEVVARFELSVARQREQLLKEAREAGNRRNVLEGNARSLFGKLERADARCYNSNFIRKPGRKMSKVNGKMAAADASPLIMPPAEFEPAHAGCYNPCWRWIAGAGVAAAQKWNRAASNEESKTVASRPFARNTRTNQNEWELLWSDQGNPVLMAGGF